MEGAAVGSGLNAQHAVYGSLAWRDLMLTVGIWSLTDLSSEGPVGLPERWAFETNPWIEASFGGDRGQLVVGLTGYSFRSPEPGTVLRRGDTWEAYAGARGAMPGAPFIGEATVYWDLDRVGGAYGEVAATLQIPVWAGLVRAHRIDFFSRAGVGSPWGRNAVSVTPVLPTTSSNTEASRTSTSRFERRFCRFRRVRSWLRLHSIPTGSGAWTRKRDDAGCVSAGPSTGLGGGGVWGCASPFLVAVRRGNYVETCKGEDNQASGGHGGAGARRVRVHRGDGAAPAGISTAHRSTRRPCPKWPPRRIRHSRHHTTAGRGDELLLSRQPAGGRLSATAVRAGHRSGG